MIRTPARSEIYAAECRLAQSKLNTLASVHRVRAALRERLAQPSSLAIAAGVAAVAGFMLMRRPRPGAHAAPATEGVAKKSLGAILLAFLVRYAMQRAPVFVHSLWMDRQRAAMQRTRDASGVSTSGSRAPGTRH